VSVRSNRSAKRRRTERQANTGPSKSTTPMEWQLADDELDEALRHTFPASDAVSVVQGVRRS
jgi:hypothetical protein